MPITTHDGVNVRNVTRVRVHDGTAVREVQRISTHDGTGVRVIFVAFSARLSANTVQGSYNGASGAPQNITTGSVVSVITGGTAPFTYLWEVIGVSPYTWTVGSPTGPVTNFTASAIPPGVETEVEFRCTITDALGFVTFAGPGLAIVRNNSIA